ncbi:UNVERIFIED_CONTAM: hypothetical protein NCL1_53732 [Trichonephila clavipes]
MRGKTARLDCSTVSLSSEELIAGEDDYGLFKAQKNIIQADSDDKNEMNKAAPVPTSFEMRNIMKNVFIYLDAHFNVRNFAPLLWYVFASPQPFVGEKISSPNHSSVIFPISGPAATQPMAGLSLLS